LIGYIHGVSAGSGSVGLLPLAALKNATKKPRSGKRLDSDMALVPIWLGMLIGFACGKIMRSVHDAIEKS